MKEKVVKYIVKNLRQFTKKHYNEDIDNKISINYNHYRKQNNYYSLLIPKLKLYLILI